MNRGLCKTEEKRKKEKRRKERKKAEKEKGEAGTAVTLTNLLMMKHYLWRGQNEVCAGLSASMKEVSGWNGEEPRSVLT